MTAAKACLNLTCAQSSAFLHQRVPFPPKKAKTGYAQKPVYQYLNQEQSYFYSSIRQTVVKPLIGSLHQYYKQSIGCMQTPPNRNCARLMLSHAEAKSLLANTTFLKDVASWPALLDAAAAVTNFLGGGSQFTELNAVLGEKPVVGCMLGHLALGAVKVEAHLKRVAELLAEQQGMNPGHRGVWLAMLDTLNVMFGLSSMPQRGIRLVDGEDPARSVMSLDAMDTDDMNEFEGGESDDAAAGGGDGE